MFEINQIGTWYFKERPEVGGGGSLLLDYWDGFRLRFSDDGLLGTIVDLWGIDSGFGKALPEIIKPSLIYGQTRDGLVHLFDCEIDQFDTHIVSVGYAVVSKYSAQLDAPPTFEELIVEFSHLDSFMDVTGFSNKLEPNNAIVLRREAVPDQIVEMGDFTLILAMEGSEELVDGSIHKRFYTEAPMVRIRFAKPRDIAGVREVLHKLHRFFSFAIGHAGTIDRIRGVLPSRGDGDKLKRLVDVVYDQPTAAPYAKSRNTRLFRYSLIAGEVAVVISKWFEVENSIEPTLTLYLEHSFRPDQHPKYSFMSLAQGIESFHRRIRGGTFVSNEEFEAVRTALKDAIPTGTDKDLSGRITQSLGYMNEYSLRRRLRDLIEQYLADFGTLITSKIPDVKKFISVVVDTRNHYTHYSNPESSDVAQGETLYQITEQLRLLIQLSILKSLGFTSEMIAAIGKLNSRFRIR